MVRPQEGGPQPEAAAGHQSVWERVKRGYLRETSVQVRALDAYLLFCMAIGALQVVYLICTAGRAYQSFLAGFIAAVGSFVLTTNARLRIADAAKGKEAPVVIDGHAAAEFVAGHVVLNLFIANFFGTYL